MYCPTVAITIIWNSNGIFTISINTLAYLKLSPYSAVNVKERKEGQRVLGPITEDLLGTNNTADVDWSGVSIGERWLVACFPAGEVPKFIANRIVGFQEPCVGPRKREERGEVVRKK